MSIHCVGVYYLNATLLIFDNTMVSKPRGPEGRTEEPILDWETGFGPQEFKFLWPTLKKRGAEKI